MKHLWIIVIILALVLLSGCDSKQNNDNNVNSQTTQDLPNLTEEEAFKIVREACQKYSIVIRLGYDIPNCESESKGMIEINGSDYIYFGSSLDTIEEFNEYLGDVFTEKSIQAIMDTQKIIIHEGKLLRLNADAGSGSMWGSAAIISMSQNGETAEVEFKVPWEVDETRFDNIQYTFKYIQDRGWLLDTEEPDWLY